MSRVAVVVESGSDVTPEVAERWGIEVVPMHVSLGGKTFDDGDITPADMLRRAEKLGELPHTSAATPADYAAVFDRAHAAHPEAHLLHLAYSAATTASYEAALTAGEGRAYVTSVDTAQVSAGQGFVAVETARFLEGHPGADHVDALCYALGVAKRIRMGFVPFDLRFLKAGGRLSNIEYVGASLLRMRPVVEILDGRLVATRRLRGSKLRVARTFVDGMLAHDTLDRSRVVLLRSPGLDPVVQGDVEARVRELGYQKVDWWDTQCVITTHCGPGTLGAVALTADGL